EPIELQYPVEVLDEVMYMPIAPLIDLYQIQIVQDDTSGAVRLMKQGAALQWGTVTLTEAQKVTASLRSEPSIKAPYYNELKQDQELIIWGEQDGWYLAQLPNGVLGYVDKQVVSLSGIEQVPFEKTPAPTVPWQPLGG